MGIYGFDAEIPEVASLPMPNAAGAALPIGTDQFTLGVPGFSGADVQMPNPYLTAADADAEPRVLGLTATQRDWVTRLAAGIEDATVALQGKQGTASSELRKQRRADVGEERAARMEERKARTEEERLGLERGRFAIAQADAKRKERDQVFADADKYLQGAAGLSDEDKAARENGLLTRMAATAPEDTVTLKTLLTNRTFAEDIRVLLPHMQPHERKALETNARSFLQKPEGVDLLRKAAENYASDDVLKDLTNRVMLTARNEKAAGVTGVIDREVLRKAIVNSPGTDATLALFNQTRFSPELHKAAESIITGGGFSASTVAAKVGETRAVTRAGKEVEAEFKGPDLSQDLRDILRREAGSGGAKDPMKPTAHEVTRAATVQQKEKIDVAAAQGAQAAVDKAAAVLNLPLSREDAQALGVPFGTTTKQAQGIVALSPAQREALGQFDAAEAIIEDIKKYSARVNTAQGFASRTYQGIKNELGALLQTNDDAVLLESKKGTLSMVSRALGEKGTLNEGDMRRAMSLIPNLWDKQSIAKTKIDDLLNLFKTIKARKPGAPQAPTSIPSAVQNLSDAELKKRLGIKEQP